MYVFSSSLKAKKKTPIDKDNRAITKRKTESFSWLIGSADNDTTACPDVSEIFFSY